MRVLRSPRLVLEPQREAHAHAMHEVLRDPAIYAFEGAPPASLDALRERFRRLESRASGDGAEQWLNWVVRLADGPCIGYVQATVAGDRAAIAYVFASAHWGQGYAREAVLAMIAELAQAYGVRELTAVLKTANARSRRLLESIAFEPSDGEADADESCMRRGALT